jgi:hypothetical protein
MAVSTYSELSYYKALSLTELGQTKEAGEILQQIKQYGEAKLARKVEIDYFATSLPLLLVFEDDLQLRNTVEAKYLIALAEKGLGNDANSKKLAREVLSLNKMHTGASDLLAQPG